MHYLYFIGEEDTMNLRKVTITSKNITPKQWSVLMLELNMIAQQWKPYAKLELQGTGLKKILNLGTRRYDAKD
jgi:hypothetical protein